jgi:hypothetical protein
MSRVRLPLSANTARQGLRLPGGVGLALEPLGSLEGLVVVVETALHVEIGQRAEPAPNQQAPQRDQRPRKHRPRAEGNSEGRGDAQGNGEHRRTPAQYPEPTVRQFVGHQTVSVGRVEDQQVVDEPEQERVEVQHHVRRRERRVLAEQLHRIRR